MSTETKLILTLLVTLLASVSSIPVFIEISHHKEIFDKKNHRTVHDGNIPRIGGVPMVLTLFFTLILLLDKSGFQALNFILGASIVVFFVGFYDDMMNISALQKVWGQIFATLVVIIPGNIRVTTLEGLLGIENLHYLPSVILTMVFFIGLINAFNLIDGIDGLASGLGILVLSFLSIFYYLNQYYEFVLIIITLVGYLIVFIYFNVFSKKMKLFLGDSGAMLIGFFVAVLSVKFYELSHVQNLKFRVNNGFAVMLSLIIVPLIDTLRVILIRLKKGGSPFHPDNNHIHHNLIQLVSKHGYATSLILFVNILVILFTWWMTRYPFNINLQLIFLISIGFILASVPFFVLKYKLAKRIK